jgi:hypothetical protein
VSPKEFVARYGSDDRKSKLLAEIFVADNDHKTCDMEMTTGCLRSSLAYACGYRYPDNRPPREWPFMMGGKL